MSGDDNLEKCIETLTTIDDEVDSAKKDMYYLAS